MKALNRIIQTISTCSLPMSFSTLFAAFFSAFAAFFSSFLILLASFFSFLLGPFGNSLPSPLSTLPGCTRLNRIPEINIGSASNAIKYASWYGIGFLSASRPDANSTMRKIIRIVMSTSAANSTYSNVRQLCGLPSRICVDEVMP